VRAGDADDGAEGGAGPGEVGGRLDGDRVAGFEGGDLFGGEPGCPKAVPEAALRAAGRLEGVPAG
jgi:hypothetical protein